MRAIVFFLVFLSLNVSAQELRFKVEGYRVNTDPAYSNDVLKANFDSLGRAQGQVKIYFPKRDTIYTFKGKALDGVLYDTAYWYNRNGKMTRRAQFVKAPSQGKLEWVQLGKGFGLYGVLHGADEEWEEGVEGKMYGSSITHYINGDKDGIEEKFNSRGMLVEQTMYSKDKKNGDRLVFDPYTGDKKLEAHYQMDYAIGRWAYYYNNTLTHYEYYNRPNTLDSVVNYIPSGEIGSKVISRGNGIVDNYEYLNGKLKNYNRLKNGRKDSVEVMYHDNGKMASKTFYVNGQEEGEYTSWFENGKVYQHYFYKEGSRSGQYQSFYENGRTKAKGKYDNGMPTGTWQRYNPSGSRLSKPTNEMNLEESPVMTEMMIKAPEIVEEVMERIDYAYEMPRPFIPSIAVKKEDKLDFLKKFKKVDLRAEVQKNGNVEYILLTPMKEKYAAQLLRYLNQTMPRWLPARFSGKPVPVHASFSIHYIKP